MSDEHTLDEVLDSTVRMNDLYAHAVSDLRKIVQEAKSNPGTWAEHLEEALEVERKVESDLRKIRRPAFVIRAVDGRGHRIPDGEEQPNAHTIEIYTEDVPISDEQINFSVEVGRTLSVLLQVFDLKMNDSRPWRRIRTHDQRKRSKWLYDLKGICHIGLEHQDPSQLKHARKLLTSFQEQFVASEAGAVKNRYLERLGFWCGLVVLLGSAGYILTVALAPESSFFYKFRNFWLLAAGAGAGTWLSFALRKVILTFLDLATLEEDQLDPGVRAGFVTTLAIVVGLLLWTGALSLDLGSFKTNTITNTGTVALTIGLVLGIAERTMSRSVFKRANDLIGTIDGR